MYSQALPGFTSQNVAINECLIRVLFLMLIMWIRNPLFTVFYRNQFLKFGISKYEVALQTVVYSMNNIQYLKL